MTPESIANAAVSVIGSFGALAGVLSRNKRLRGNIRDNLRLLDELQANSVIRDHTPAITWLSGRVALDVARLAKQPLGNPKRPISKGGVTLATVVAAGFGLWTYTLDKGGFVWYSLFPGTVVAITLFSILGMTTNREIPQDEGEPAKSELPTARSGDSDSAETEVAADS
ncbi:hypothetical protein SAMN05216223_105314 [Actinacidiphila yanglinensis]|uniref:Uncharacterized protein n=1 Tax=Actinacidiphila yanglinensis TaxID=310779 RepID=A0A1H6AE05_9ACTN|nr:hypothetical protein [Actinacidiphila yanglinensis]SEG46255.1 hypothetical protein SAMN05216223_105314 [Actinacidiphila yanglinensis]